MNNDKFNLKNVEDYCSKLHIYLKPTKKEFKLPKEMIVEVGMTSHEYHDKCVIVQDSMVLNTKEDKITWKDKVKERYFSLVDELDKTMYEHCKKNNKIHKVYLLKPVQVCKVKRLFFGIQIDFEFIVAFE